MSTPILSQDPLVDPKIGILHFVLFTSMSYANDGLLNGPMSNIKKGTDSEQRTKNSQEPRKPLTTADRWPVRALENLGKIHCRSAHLPEPTQGSQQPGKRRCCCWVRFRARPTVYTARRVPRRKRTGRFSFRPLFSSRLFSSCASFRCLPLLQLPPSTV